MQNEKAEKLLSEISKRKHVIKSFANAVAGVSFAALTCAASVGEYNLFQKNNEIYAAAAQDHAAGRLHLNQHFLESHELSHLAFARDKHVYAQDTEIQKKYLNMIEPTYFGDLGSPFGGPILFSLVTAYFAVGARDSYAAHKAPKQENKLT